MVFGTEIRAGHSGGGPPHSKTLRAERGLSADAERLGVLQPSGAFPPARPDAGDAPYPHYKNVGHTIASKIEFNHETRSAANCGVHLLFGTVSMIPLRNRSRLARFVFAILSLLPIRAICLAFMHRGYKSKFNAWISQDEHPSGFWLYCFYMALLATLFLFIALSPNRKPDA